MAVQTASDFDPDLIDSFSFSLPADLEEIRSEADEDLLALKASSLGAARGLMVALGLEVGIPLFFLVVWQAWSNWR